MQMQKKRAHRHWITVLTTVILAFALAPAALADTGSDTPKIAQQPDQLVLQLGTRWAGVEFELRTDAGIFPVPVVVDETGVLRMDLGGSTTYTLSCIESSVPIPTPESSGLPAADGDTQPADGLPPQQPSQTPAPDPAPASTQQSVPLGPLVVFLIGLAAAGGALVTLQISKHRAQAGYDEWDDEDDEGSL